MLAAMTTEQKIPQGPERSGFAPPKILCKLFVFNTDLLHFCLNGAEMCPFRLDEMSENMYSVFE